MKGIFPLYKPRGITSHDVIKKLRAITGEQTIGHAGTLDPLARGVLVVGIGRDATKKLHEVVAEEKEYIAELRFGVTSTTDDEEGEKTEIQIAKIPGENEIRQAFLKFSGNILQVPPVYSAVKIKGKAAYAYARKGEMPHLKTRSVFVKEIELLSYAWPLLKLRVVTGPGVYIRSLARDLGTFLHVGAYLTDLERTRVGSHTAARAIPLEKFPS